jgi:hypothetical protein
MLSNSRLAVWLALSAPTLCGQNSFAPAFGCPTAIQVAETASVPSAWHGEGATLEHRFVRPSISNGEPGKDEAELAPDDTRTQGRQVKETWKISDYRDRNVFLRCRYENTAATVVTDAPTRIKSCTFTFRNAPGNQSVTAPAFSCQ